MNLIPIVLVVIAAAATALPPRSRIFGGQNAAAGQFPFMVALENPEQFCGAVIVNTQWLVTAASCAEMFNNRVTALVGTHKRDCGGTRYEILEAIVHEDYQEEDQKNDISLVKIDGTLEYSDTVQPIEFGDGDINENCTVMGWGVYNATFLYANILQYAETKIIDIELCKELAKTSSINYLGPETLCTVAEKEIGACAGDTGGALVCGGKLAGVRSYSIWACGLEYPEVFTRLSDYADWIQDII